MAGQATQVELLLSGLKDTSGEPLAGGKVYTYTAGTTTEANLYLDKDESSSATNPIVLDSNGRALVFASGFFKFIVRDADDTMLYSWDYLYFGDESTDSSLITTDASTNTLVKAALGKSIKFQQNSNTIFEVDGATSALLPAVDATYDLGSSSKKIRNGYFSALGCSTQTGVAARDSWLTQAQLQDGTVIYAGDIGGSASALTLTPSPAMPALVKGAVVRCYNTLLSVNSAATLNVSGLGAKAIYNIESMAQIKGPELVTGGVYELIYDGTNWVLLNPTSQWTPYTPTFYGFSTNPTFNARYLLRGKFCTVVLHCTVDGISNSIYTTVDAPFYAQSITNVMYYGVANCIDNGSVVMSGGKSWILSSTNNIGIAPHILSSASPITWTNYWTASGAKSVSFVLQYEVA